MSNSITLAKREYTVLCRTLCAALMCSLLALVSPTAMAVDEADLNYAEGIVQEVSVATSKLQITGIVYDVEPYATVEVRGVSSSIAALQVGMKVRFVYVVMEGLDAEIAAVQESSVISEIEQLPDNYVVEEF